MRLSVYKLVTKIASPLIDLYLHRRLKAGKEDPARFNERLGHPSAERTPGKLAWIHGASIGESLSALPMIHAIHQSWPETQILVTTGTVTSAKLMAARLPQGAIHQYIPVDRVEGIRRFLDHWKPDIALWMESEFWPNLLLETKAFGTPMVLINGRVSERSYKRWAKNRPMIEALLECFTLCLGQTDGDAERLKDLGAKTVESFGNLKAAADALPYDIDDFKLLTDQISGRPVWLAASTHPGEEEICLKIHDALSEAYPGLLTIIVPRHPQRGPEIRRKLRDQTSADIVLRSRREPVTNDTAVYVADTIGELGLFYRLCPITVIGKTIGAKGGQNPLEPARIGSAILFGPDMDNFRDMAETMKQMGAAREVQEPSELAHAISELMENPAKREAMMVAGEAFSDKEAEVLDRIMSGLNPILSAELGTPS